MLNAFNTTLVSARRLFFTGLVLCVAISLNSQSYQHQIRSLVVEDGLLNRDPCLTFKNSSSFICIGLSNGLHCLDGTLLLSVGASVHYFADTGMPFYLVEDQIGMVWVVQAHNSVGENSYEFWDTRVDILHTEHLELLRAAVYFSESIPFNCSNIFSTRQNTNRSYEQ